MSEKREPLSAVECERLSKSGAVIPTEGQRDILWNLYWKEGVPMTWEELLQLSRKIKEELAQEAAEAIKEDLERIAREDAEKERLKKEKAKARRKKSGKK